MSRTLRASEIRWDSDELRPDDRPELQESENAAATAEAAILDIEEWSEPAPAPTSTQSRQVRRARARREVKQSRATVTRSPILTPLGAVTPADVRWLWPGRLAGGKYTLLAGEPGVGKTYLALFCAARFSRGDHWPDGPRAPMGNVLYLTAEDGIGDTLRPRIDRLGGDPSRIVILEAVRDADGTRRSLSVARDLDVLGQAVREVQPVLVVIDPLTAYLGRTDAHRDAEVRGVLAPFVDLLEQQHCALLAIGHLSKDQQRAALHRPGGSIAFVAAARLVLAVAADPRDPERRLLAPIKSNLCCPAPVLAYRIGDDGLTWERDAVAGMTAETLLRPTGPGDREDETDAEKVIRELLEDTEAWPLDARQALDAGRAHGIPDRTLQWTARRLGIVIRRIGFGRGGKWVWRRPVAIDAAGSLEPQTAASIASITSITENRPSIDVNNNIDVTKSAFTRAREEDDHDGVF